MRLIHNPQSVTCPLCNKPFKTKLYLKRHLVSFHELTVADRQRQEEIYQHQVKVQVQGQTQVQTGAQTQTQAQAQTQAQIQTQTQVDNKVLLAATAPPTPWGGNTAAEENGGAGGGGGGGGSGGGGCGNGNAAEPKLRSYQTQAGDNAYSVEVAQIGDSKHFASGMLQFDATHH